MSKNTLYQRLECLVTVPFGLGQDHHIGLGLAENFRRKGIGKATAIVRIRRRYQLRWTS